MSVLEEYDHFAVNLNSRGLQELLERHVEEAGTALQDQDSYDSYMKNVYRIAGALDMLKQQLSAISVSQVRMHSAKWISTTRYKQEFEQPLLASICETINNICKYNSALTKLAEGSFPFKYRKASNIDVSSSRQVRKTNTTTGFQPIQDGKEVNS